MNSKTRCSMLTVAVREGPPSERVEQVLEDDVGRRRFYSPPFPLSTVRMTQLGNRLHESLVCLSVGQRLSDRFVHLPTSARALLNSCRGVRCERPMPTAAVKPSARASRRGSTTTILSDSSARQPSQAVRNAAAFWQAVDCSEDTCTRRLPNRYPPTSRRACAQPEPFTRAAIHRLTAPDKGQTLRTRRRGNNAARQVLEHLVRQPEMNHSPGCHPDDREQASEPVSYEYAAADAMTETDQYTGRDTPSPGRV